MEEVIAPVVGAVGEDEMVKVLSSTLERGSGQEGEVAGVRE